MLLSLVFKRNIKHIVLISIMVALATSTLIATYYVGENYYIKILIKNLGANTYSLKISFDGNLSIGEYRKLVNDINRIDYVSNVVPLLLSHDVFNASDSNLEFNFLGVLACNDLDMISEYVSMNETSLDIEECLVPVSFFKNFNLTVGEYISFRDYLNRSLTLRLIGYYSPSIAFFMAGLMGVSGTIIVNISTLNSLPFATFSVSVLLLYIDFEEVWRDARNFKMMYEKISNVEKGVATVLKAHGIPFYRIENEALNYLRASERRLESLYDYLTFLNLLVTIFAFIIVNFLLLQHISSHIHEFSVLKTRGGLLKFFAWYLSLFFIGVDLLTSVLNLILTPLVANIFVSSRIIIAVTSESLMRNLVTSLMVNVLASIPCILIGLRLVLQIRNLPELETPLSTGRIRLQRYLLLSLTGLLAVPLSIMQGYRILNSYLMRALMPSIYASLITLEKVFMVVAPLFISIFLGLLVMKLVHDLLSRVLSSRGVIYLKVFTKNLPRLKRSLMLLSLSLFITMFFIINSDTGYKMVTINSEMLIGSDISIFLNPELFDYNSTNLLKLENILLNNNDISIYAKRSKLYYLSELRIESNMEVQIIGIDKTVIFYGVDPSYFRLRLVKKYVNLEHQVLSNNTVVVNTAFRRFLGDKNEITLQIINGSKVMTFDFEISDTIDFMPGITDDYYQLEHGFYVLLDISTFASIMRVLNVSLQVEEILIDVSNNATTWIVKQELESMVAKEFPGMSNEIIITTLEECMERNYGDFLTVYRYLNNVTLVLGVIMMMATVLLVINSYNANWVEINLLIVRGVPRRQAYALFSLYLMFLILVIVLTNLFAAALFVYNFRLVLNVINIDPLGFKVPSGYLLYISITAWLYVIGLLASGILISVIMSYIISRRREDLLRMIRNE